jgi:hypothetical protein
LDLANSPQAKGRVERRNGLLQDRLVKELRLAGISDLEGANRFLEEQFLPELNRRFWVKPAQEADVHRGLPRDLAEVLSWEQERVVQRDWTVAWNRRWFQIERGHEGLCLAGKTVIVRELRDGSVQLVKGTQKLGWRELPRRPQGVSQSRPHKVWVEPTKPQASHPWRQLGTGVGKEFWRGVKTAGRAARQASRALRSASATLRPPSVPGMPATKRVSAKNQTKGTFSPELTKGHF